YGEGMLDWLQVVTPIAIEVAFDVIPLVEGSAQNSLSPALSKQLTNMRSRIQNQFGVKIPGVRVRGSDADLPPGTYVIMIMEIPRISGNISPDRRFFPGSREALSSLGISGEEAKNPLTGENGFWVKQDDWQKLESAGLEVWEVIEYPIRDLGAVLRRNFVDLFGHQEVADFLTSESSKLLEEIHTRPEKLTIFTTLCRALVAEQVPVKPLGELFRTFDRLSSERQDLQTIAESIRALPAFRKQL